MIARLAGLPILMAAAVIGIGGAALDAQRGTSRKPATHTVTIDASQFSPATLTVRSGDTIVWVNKDILAHTATSTGGGFDSNVIEAGKSWKLVVKKKGSFPYTCSFHPMNGHIIVR